MKLRSKFCFLENENLLAKRVPALSYMVFLIIGNLMCCCIGASENIGMFSNSVFACLCLKDKLGLCSINCHIHAMTANCSSSLQLLLASDLCGKGKSAF